MKRMKLFFLLAVLGVVAVPGAAQTLNVGVGGAFTSMDPHYHNLGPNNVLTSYVFSGLVRFDPKFTPEPDLATSWTTVSPNVWEFKLREGVTFTDGSPFTADDVVFTLGRIPTVLNSPSSFNFAVKPISKIEVIDAHTLRFHTTEPQPLMPYNLANVRIVSRKNGEGAGTGDYNNLKAAIGIGPYRVTDFIVGDHAVLRRNDSWWDKKPAWETVNYRAIANNASRDAALESGDVDVIDQVPTRDVAQLRKNPKLSILAVAGQRLIYLFVDTQRASTPFAADLAGKPMAENPLRDVRVRKALSLAINRDGIRDRIMDGFAAPTGQLTPQGASGYDPSVKPDPYDPAQAKKLLADAGLANGFGLTLHGPNDRYVNDSAIVEAIAQGWTRIGVKTAVDTMPSATFFSRALRAEFSVDLTGWASDSGEASSNLIQIIASSNPEKGRGAIINPAHYANAAMDALIERAVATIDPAAREDLYRQAMREAMPDQPVIPIHHQVNVWAMRKGLTMRERMQEGVRAWEVRPE
ncbi:MAG: peptide/nickel transport system substrate-binding protein [Acetobacteraceae bacterium]|jgi:peptide/nickel transport system substrate-binding protein|nr:peptide/nickel transport system substrate-binding protein [Acetobacteraceae bacterium]